MARNAILFCQSATADLDSPTVICGETFNTWVVTQIQGLWDHQVNILPISSNFTSTKNYKQQHTSRASLTKPYSQGSFPWSQNSLGKTQPGRELPFRKNYCKSLLRQPERALSSASAPSWTSGAVSRSRLLWNTNEVAARIIRRTRAVPRS